MPAATLPVFDKTFSALLFDMDGTLINSIAVAERIWGAWAAGHGLDITTFLPTMHGVRGIDIIGRLALPGVDPVSEAQAVLDAEMDDVDGIVPLPGAIDFLNSLPSGRWAIVTSAPRELALKRLHATGIPIPPVLVTAEDVVSGKPSPECFLLGAKKLGFDAADCLVCEDAAAGILAGDAAGAKVLVITSTHAHPIETAHTTTVDYSDITATVDAAGKISLGRKAA